MSFVKMVTPTTVELDELAQLFERVELERDPLAKRDRFVRVELGGAIYHDGPFTTECAYRIAGAIGTQFGLKAWVQ